MRYFVLPREGLADDVKAALTRGLGLSSQDLGACERHCQRYGIEDVALFVEELGEAHAALATARALGVPILMDWHGRLCYDVPLAPDDGSADEEEGWQDDAWLAALLEGTKAA